MRASAQLPLFPVVGFSGRRHVHDSTAAVQAVRAALGALRREGTGEWIALSSVAAGADVLFAQEALAMHLAWHALLPMPPMEFRHDFSPDEWKVSESLLSEAEQVEVIGETGARDDAYLDGGLETVNGSDVLVAL